MKTNEEKVISTKFIKRPRKGQICKVHFPDKTHKFGIVQGVKVKKRTQDGVKYLRERLVLKHTSKTPDLNDCDYILESCKVIFLKTGKKKLSL